MYKGLSTFYTAGTKELGGDWEQGRHQRAGWGLGAGQAPTSWVGTGSRAGTKELGGDGEQGRHQRAGRGLGAGIVVLSKLLTGVGQRRFL